MRALLALLALGALLTLHELAHLLAARIFGTRAIVFSFGIGPPLFGFRALGQRWTLGAIPFGGWLRLEGENPHDATRASGVPFAALSVARRLAIFAAGPLGSWLVGVGLLAALFAAGTHQPVATEVGAVDPGSLAARAGFHPGDRVLSVDGAAVHRWSEPGGGARPCGGRNRGGRGRPGRRDARPPDRARARCGGARPGRASASCTASSGSPPREAARQAVVTAGVVLGRLLREAGQVLAQPWWGAARNHTVGALVWGAAEAAGASADALVRALAALSLGLALFFLLPLPALDGGRMLLTVWEAATGRPVDARVQTLLQTLSLLAGVAAVGWLAYGEVRQALSVTLLR